MENSVKVTPVMMVSKIFRPPYITLTFSHNTQGYHYCYHSRQQQFSFNMLICVILELYLTSKRKPKNFSNSVKRNTLSQFEFIALKIVCVTFLLVYFLSLNKSTCQTRKNVLYFTSKALFVLEKIKSQNSTFSNFLM